MGCKTTQNIIGKVLRDMSGIWIGIDGGGSKTAFLAVAEDGRTAATYQTQGTDYHEVGVDTVCQRLTEGVNAVRTACEDDHVLGICFGMPTFGEGGDSDHIAAEKVRAALSPWPVHIVNDVEVGWAGSMALSPGVNIVAGTGSIAYGRDAHGSSARCGGWMEFFSDEGSGYWLGKRTLELFAKQSDGRIPKSYLYEFLKTELELVDDFALINLVRDKYAPSREQTASLQLVLERAVAGDDSAIQLYQEAGRELAMIVNGVIGQLNFDGAPAVSYSGGIFKSGDLIFTSFHQQLEREAHFVSPKLPPVKGAVLLAVEEFAPAQLDRIRESLL